MVLVVVVEVVWVMVNVFHICQKQEIKPTPLRWILAYIKLESSRLFRFI